MAMQGQRPGQMVVPRSELVSTIRKILASDASEPGR